ncbi:MAG: hypothetical protein QF659_08885, partial [Dehalococcoidia bacterium]|nr:hypothetical protein [Dehalococcoidia bacterium]
MRAVAAIRHPAVALAAVAVTLLLAACGNGNGATDRVSPGADNSPDRGTATATPGVTANAPGAEQPNSEEVSASSTTTDQVG